MPECRTEETECRAAEEREYRTEEERGCRRVEPKRIAKKRVQNWKKNQK
jgi:hypothetical protein